ncbi:amidohydrolase [Proteiniclasticum ruminis]|uniref:Amidohydrolase n=1 Tax=Proteiniclasticum ruminis TaxID=398199 RepID=A0A1I5CED9_9CLOT|nr:amidohydrolase [Proteiniclasticum ruminis]SFN85380.1 amidohydrolase [Proteiniclasticum ruminis]
MRTLSPSIEKYRDYVIGARRHLHAHPETSLEEIETTAYLMSELDAMGIPYIKGEPTGLVATIKGKKPGKTVALRSDMDALNILEKNEVSYKSQVDGKMHACGHDGHTAILLGAARILKDQMEELPGTVHLVFQPAEETGHGAKLLINTGTWYEETDNIFGAHLWSYLPTGKISLEPGQRMAATDRFQIKIQGLSGHGSMPHQTVDAVVAASAMVMNFQTIVSREYSPMEPLVVSVGSIHSGTAFNIISGEAVLEGTIRYFSKDIGKTIESSMRRVMESTAALYGASAEMMYTYNLPPVVNDEASSALAYEAASRILGEENIVLQEKTTGGEDFAFYLDHKPGCFVFIGSGNHEKGTDFAHHNDHFDLDEDVLLHGSALYAEYAVSFLKKEAKKGENSL